MKKLLAALTVLGTIALGTGAAWADTSGSPDPSGPQPATGRGPRHRPVQELIGVAAKTIGISKQELVRQLRAGKAIADVAKAHHVDPRKIVDALVDAAKKRIDSAVKSGNLSSERAKKLDKSIAKRIDQLVHTKGPKKGPRSGAELRRPGPGGRNARGARGSVLHAALQAAAKTIGVSSNDLAQDVRGGQSIADVANAHGVDTTKVVNAMVDAAKQAIEDATKGKQVDAQRVQRLEQRLPKLMQRFVDRAGAGQSF